MAMWSAKEIVLWQEAVYYYELGKYEQAKRKFLEVLSHEPADEIALYYAASCAFYLEEIEEAETYAKAAVKSGTQKEICFALLGAICIEKKAYVKAEEWLLATLHENPQNAGVMAQYAYLMLQTGYEEKAKHLLAHAQYLGHDDETVLHYQYFFQRAYEQPMEQEETIRSYVRVAGNRVDKLVKLGLLALDKEAYREARAYFTQAYRMNPLDEHLVQVLERLDKLIHPMNWPERILLKTGGPSVWWIMLILCLYILAKLHWYSSLMAVGIFAILVCGYFWFSPFLYKWTCKMARRG